MKDELFNELIASVREGGRILRGKTKPSRTFILESSNAKRRPLSHKRLEAQKNRKPHKHHRD